MTFDEWESTQPRIYFWETLHREIAINAWNAATEAVQSNLEQKDREIEVLRKFANKILFTRLAYHDPYFNTKQAVYFGLLDTDGETPTKLLEGEK